jgi:hypothetical protein
MENSQKKKKRSENRHQDGRGRCDFKKNGKLKWVIVLAQHGVLAGYGYQ